MKKLHLSEELLYVMPMNNEKFAQELRKLLASIDFDKRYYAFVESHRNFPPMKDIRQEQLATAIANASLDVVYVKKEIFYKHIELHPVGKIGLNIFFSHSNIEAIFVFHSPGVAGSYHGLARDIGEMRNPNFCPEPPYPRLPFSNVIELQEAVDLVVQLFQEGKKLILAYNSWTI